MQRLLPYAFLIVSIPCSAQTASHLPDGPARPIVEKSCVGCHTIKVVTSKRASHDEWAALVDQMVSKGAQISDDDLEEVVKYLATNFGKAQADIPDPNAPSLDTIHNDHAGKRAFQSILVRSGVDIITSASYAPLVRRNVEVFRPCLSSNRIDTY